ncbi:related to Aspartic proteinase 3 [Zygosaccharomyces bailii]|nr:related to Aspartic proteinase 3 [Zygosaccharomyces bailii]
MKFLNVLAYNFLAASLANGATVRHNSVAFDKSPRAVRLSFDKHQARSFEEVLEGKGGLEKRDGDDVSFDLKNELNFYSVALQIGTPGQEVTVLLDTGSSDFWVPSSENPYCKSPSQSGNGTQQEQNEVQEKAQQTLTGGRTATKAGTSQTSATLDCSQYGNFSSNKSSSFRSNNTGFSVAYGDGSYASGTWGTDVVAVGGINMTGVSIGVANVTNSSVGILGIGLKALENTYTGVQNVKNGDTREYANFPMMLKSEGFIDKNVYSLYLNSKDAPQGSILFGAVDHSKYTGQLYTVPILNLYKKKGLKDPLQLQVTLQGVGVQENNNTNTTTTTPVPALLDSGTTLVYLPDEMASLLAEQIGAQWDERIQYYISDCSNLDDAQLFYNFGGFNIASNLSSYIVGHTGQHCVLGIQPSGGDSAILGDMFMEHAYVVFDLERFEISLAQARYDSGQEQVEVVTKKVPSAKKAPGYSSTYSTSQSILPTGNIFTISGSSVSGSSSTSMRTKSGDNVAADLAPAPLLALFVHFMLSFLL